MRGEVALWIEEYGLYVRTEVLPDAGGMRDQDARTLTAFAVLHDERMSIESAQLAERAKGGKDGRRAGK